MKKFFGVLAVLCFVCVIGTAGAVDQNMTTLSRGCVQMALFLAGFAGFTKLAGGFE